MLLTLFVAPQASACSTCQAGDPTLTIMGHGKPFEGRLRASLEFRYRTEDIGVPGVSSEELSEYRTSLGIAWTPHERMTLGLSVPMVGKQLALANQSEERSFFLGDIEVNARVFVWRDRHAMPRHLLGVVAGLRVPSAPELEDSAGVPLSFDAQAGNGAWVPSAGLWYGYFRHPFSLYLSSVGYFTAGGFGAFEAGDAWVNTLMAQWAPELPVALQLGFDTRAATRDVDAGVVDPDSGGFIGFLTPGIVFSPTEDLLLSVRVMIPVIDQLDGNHDEGVSVLAGVTYDL